MNALAKLAQYLEQILFLGGIQAGLPVAESPRIDRLDDFDMESLRIPKSMRTFALKVRGDSMINAGIHDGDVVILDFERQVKNRDIVAALIDGDSTLKRYVVQRGKPFLKAENPAFPALIPAQELVIQGVMVALFRQVT
ncbi:LexA family protein [Prosthecobacter sp.]|uniref:LexA family protein n=1 Tax=Prosthecobacter sp. TaxID=1965333 RepID=UPI0037840B8E